MTSQTQAKFQSVATAHMVGEFIKRGYQPAAFMNAMEIGQRVVDPTWHGTGRQRPPRPRHISSVCPTTWKHSSSAGLKHFAPDLKTMTLDNMYHVHASWSFPNASLEEWANNLKVMTSKFRRKLRKCLCLKIYL